MVGTWNRDTTYKADINSNMTESITYSFLILISVSTYKFAKGSSCSNEINGLHGTGLTPFHDISIGANADPGYLITLACQQDLYHDLSSFVLTALCHFSCAAKGYRTLHNKALKIVR